MICISQTTMGHGRHGTVLMLEKAINKEGMRVCSRMNVVPL